MIPWWTLDIVHSRCHTSIQILLAWRARPTSNEQEHAESRHSCGLSIVLPMFFARPPPPSPALPAYGFDLMESSLFIGQPTNIVVASLGVALVFAIMHMVLAVLLPRCSKMVAELAPAARSDLCIQLMWLLFCTPIPLLYAAAIPELYSSVEQRWLGTSWYCELAMLLHLGSSLYEAAVYLVFSKPLVYMVHHAIVVYAYGIGLFVGAMHFWGAWHGLTEASNINLSILKICLILKLGRGSIGEIINGMCLYSIFLFVRLFASCSTHATHYVLLPTSHCPLSYLLLPTPCPPCFIRPCPLNFSVASTHCPPLRLRRCMPTCTCTAAAHPRRANGPLHFLPSHSQVRVVSLPLLGALFAYDAYTFPELTYGAPAGDMLTLIRRTTPLCTLAIWGFSATWFVLKAPLTLGHRMDPRHVGLCRLASA